MADFIHAAPWLHHPASSNAGTVTPSRLQSHLRSLTPTPANKQVTKSVSTPQLGRLVVTDADPQTDSEGMNTIPDPRAPSIPRPPLSRNDSSDSAMHPDFSQEVATLSTKLINAINHSTALDDSLQQTRQQLDVINKKLARAEAQNREYEQWIATGQLVEKEVFAKLEKQMLSELQEERKRRAEAEKAKRRVDSEVETLTSALFEEANGMVSSARKETEACEKRNEQLRQQLVDAESLQQSLQEQMQDLKLVMERMSLDRDDNESNTLPTTTAPSTPGITPADKMNKLFEAVNLTPNTPGAEEITPDHPLHFSHLIHPVLRSDLPSFSDFQDMLKISARSAPSSRVSSGNYGSLNVLGLGSFTNSSTSSLPIARSPNSVGNNSPRDSIAGAGLPNLKDEKYYKRTQTEDIEPTLRLDLAPGLSWMARRTALSSITTGAFVVEPNSPPPKFRGPVFPCSLCGENRKGDEYARKFRFRTSDTEETKYPLCDWCLGRVRSTCDYVGFLRMVAAGHWRAETEEEKKGAWEESVRLRERMFWSRLGGGVVPAFLQTKDSLHSPVFANGRIEAIRKSEESQRSTGKPLDSAVDMSDPFSAQSEDGRKRVSIGKTVISIDPTPETLTKEEEEHIEAQAEAQLHNEVRKSLEIHPTKQSLHQRSASTPAPREPSSKKKEERLSLTIPGSFD
ncbi:Sec2p-domain-containing protein [Aaosphaeria arxii CBS 175.79]|uniref:Sec2p-domain-containing protein n=1 Tax=Aaosphaeria arxii CBS 175.79 TaxID=1450172 RepID=A0A6A5YAI1_9PLEO|nr:Sec2p-domain-containing protein [Aaosphaeria arxii CBS 175.79]KAF2021594.1 Sec2p-domain-containing protein [Aaosphaeria arxii CBS 175.79]